MFGKHGEQKCLENQIYNMTFKSTFNIGDKLWAIVQEPRQLTVAQIRIEYTDSKGIDDKIMFDNYKPQKSYKETYMCEETGVGSGNVFTLGEHCFKTKEECQAAITKIFEQS